MSNQQPEEESGLNPALKFVLWTFGAGLFAFTVIGTAVYFILPPEAIQQATFYVFPNILSLGVDRLRGAAILGSLAGLICSVGTAFLWLLFLVIRKLSS